MKELAPALKRIAVDNQQSAARRIAALWALEGLHAADAEMLKPLLADADRNIRREAIRAHRDNRLPLSVSLDAIAPLVDDVDPEVRAEIIRTTGALLTQSLESPGAGVDSFAAMRAMGVLITSARAPMAGPTMESTRGGGRMIKIGEAYDREFERYLARLEMEKHPGLVAKYLEDDVAEKLPIENRLVATLALEPAASASRVAQLLPKLNRPPSQDEILRLAQFPDAPGVGEAVKAGLQDPVTRKNMIESLLQVRSRLDAAKVEPLIRAAARDLFAGDASSVALGIKTAGAFQIAELAPELTAVLRQGLAKASEKASANDGKVILSGQSESALRALRELRAGDVELFATLAKSNMATEIKSEALNALAVSRDERGASLLLGFWPDLNAAQRRSALSRLTGTKPGAQAVVDAIKSGVIAKPDLDGPAFDKLQTVFGDSAELKELLGDMATLFRPCLRLNGADNAWAETDLTLSGPFTVETWVKLDPGIDNNDGILGAPGSLDMNFAGELFRVYVGGATHDAIVARKKIHPDIWTHLAVTRDAAGRFRIYMNGELDTADSKVATQKFEHCQIGRTTPGKGTAGWLSEFRVWNRVRTPEEIRAEFDRSYEGSPAEGLVGYFSSTNWGKLQAGCEN